MVIRVFDVLGRRPRLLTVPLWAFRLAVTILRRLPRYRQWSAAMAERMNRDLVFDHTDAARDCGFKPRAFELTAEGFADMRIFRQWNAPTCCTAALPVALFHTMLGLGG